MYEYLLKPNMFKHFYILILAMFLFSCQQKIETLNTDIAYSYRFTTEDHLNDKEYQTKIKSFFNTGKEGFFKGKLNINIYYKFFENQTSNKCIVISNGRTEAVVKYKELIFDLYHNGYSIYIHDHRGQGFSDRITNNPHMGYIDNFQFYIDDLKTFYDKFIPSKNYNKKYLLAHSMGGAIGASYLEQNFNDFDAACLSSPMLGLSTYIEPLVNILIKDKPSYAIGQKDFDENEVSFTDNQVTYSKIRYINNCKLYKQQAKVQLGGVTYKWLKESCKQFKYIFKNINRIETPLLLFSAENETIVNPKAHFNFFKKAKKHQIDIEAYLVKDTKHELFMEKDKSRSAILNKTLCFFNKY